MEQKMVFSLLRRDRRDALYYRLSLIWFVVVATGCGYLWFTYA
jgi:hypothetical protein